MFTIILYYTQHIHSRTLFQKPFIFMKIFHISPGGKKSTKTAIEKLLKYFVLQLHETYNTISILIKSTKSHKTFYNIGKMTHVSMKFVELQVFFHTFFLSIT